MTATQDKQAICDIIISVDKAFYERDAAKAVAPYAPGAVVFDLAPPFTSDTATDRKGVQDWLDTWDGPVDRRSHDFDISVSGDLAVCHGFYSVNATTKDGGEAVEFWSRATVVLKRVDGRWAIVHEHISVPFHMDGSFRAAIDLKP